MGSDAAAHGMSRGVFEREDAFATVFGNQILMKITPEWFLASRIDLSRQRAVSIKPGYSDQVHFDQSIRQFVRETIIPSCPVLAKEIGSL